MMKWKLRELKCLRAFKCLCQDSNPGYLISKLALLTPKSVCAQAEDTYSLLLLFSCQVVSDSLWPHRLQHVRSLCHSPSPRVCPCSCRLNQWCHPTTLSSVVLFFCLQSFPASGSFPKSRLFASGGQSIGASKEESQGKVCACLCIFGICMYLCYLWKCVWNWKLELHPKRRLYLFSYWC